MERKLLGYCAVDSGQLIMVDPCYLSDWKDGEFKPDQEPDNHYAKACRITLDDKNFGGQMVVGGKFGSGVVFRTGCGDGSYPVYADYENIGTNDEPDWRISCVFIDFQIVERSKMLQTLRENEQKE